MGLMDRDYMRATPRWHMGEHGELVPESKPDYVRGPRRAYERVTADGQAQSTGGSAAGRALLGSLVCALVCGVIWACTGGVRLTGAGASPPPSTGAAASTSAPSDPCQGAILGNKDWAPVSLQPAKYVGCAVDVAANMYNIQAMDGYVTYDAQLDPNGSYDWTAFADYSEKTPPAIANNTYVEIKGTITQATEAYNSVGGAAQGYVPEMTVAAIVPISAATAHQLGMSLGS